MINAELSVAPLLLSTALARLRNTAWVLGCALITACCGLAFALITANEEPVAMSAVVLMALGAAVCVSALLDLLVRLNHYQDIRVPMPCFIQRFVREQAFRPLPSHLIDKGEQAVDGAVEAWLNALTEDSTELRAYAQQRRSARGFLRKADAVNLQFYASLRRRQLMAGYLSC